MQSYVMKDLAESEVRHLCRRNPITDPEIMETCRVVFDAVASRGDQAVRDYTREFDGVEIENLSVAEADFAQAEEAISDDVRGALEAAAANIEKFHRSQLYVEGRVETARGVTCWRESRPIESVGLYIPGGNAVLPSTVLMLAIPAQLAGCSRTILCVPPKADGTISPEVLVAARLAGVSQVFRIGGAQAVAALAVGTETVPKVEKILGPGNRWVQGAKLLATLNGVAIDMVAGPSEVLVIADDSADCRLVAGDLIAQAEHGADSAAVLVSVSASLITGVAKELSRQLTSLPRIEFASAALKASFSLEVENLEKAFDFSNLYAPEHLILHVENASAWVPRIQSAGSVFLGPWSPEVAGDYASGTNHTLPTSGLARCQSGVSLDTFVKKVTFQQLTEDGLRGLESTLTCLARVEGLDGHRRAVELRFEEAEK